MGQEGGGRWTQRARSEGARRTHAVKGSQVRRPGCEVKDRGTKEDLSRLLSLAAHNPTMLIGPERVT
jgi:hypothetical protein